MPASLDFFETVKGVWMCQIPFRMILRIREVRTRYFPDSGLRSTDWHMFDETNEVHKKLYIMTKEYTDSRKNLPVSDATDKWYSADRFGNTPITRHSLRTVAQEIKITLDRITVAS